MKYFSDTSKLKLLEQRMLVFYSIVQPSIAKIAPYLSMPIERLLAKCSDAASMLKS